MFSFSVEPAVVFPNVNCLFTAGMPNGILLVEFVRDFRPMPTKSISFRLSENFPDTVAVPTAFTAISYKPVRVTVNIWTSGKLVEILNIWL